jgi:hypothetical protein
MYIGNATSQRVQLHLAALGTTAKPLPVIPPGYQLEVSDTISGTVDGLGSRIVALADAPPDYTGLLHSATPIPSAVLRRIERGLGLPPQRKIPSYP